MKYFEAEKNHGIFVKKGAKNVTLAKVVSEADVSKTRESLENEKNDFLDGWGEENPFANVTTGSNIADWGSPIPDSSNMTDVSIKDGKNEEKESPTTPGLSGLNDWGLSGLKDTTAQAINSWDITNTPNNNDNNGKNDISDTNIDQWNEEEPKATPMKTRESDESFLGPVNLSDSFELAKASEKMGEKKEQEENSTVFYGEEGAAISMVKADEQPSLFAEASIRKEEEEEVEEEAKKGEEKVEESEKEVNEAGSKEEVNEKVEEVKQEVEVKKEEVEDAGSLFGDGVDDPFDASSAPSTKEESTVQREDRTKDDEQLKEESEPKDAGSLFGDGVDDPLGATSAPPSNEEPKEEEVEVKKEEVEVKKEEVEDAGSLFGDGVDDPFGSTTAPLSNEGQQEEDAAALFGGSSSSSDPFATATLAEEDAANLFGGVGSSTDDNPFATVGQQQQQTSSSSDPFALKNNNNNNAASMQQKEEEVPDLFGSVPDNLFGSVSTSNDVFGSTSSSPFVAQQNPASPSPPPLKVPSYVSPPGSGNTVTAPIPRPVPTPAVKQNAQPQVFSPASVKKVPSFQPPVSLPFSSPPVPVAVPSTNSEAVKVPTVSATTTRVNPPPFSSPLVKAPTFHSPLVAPPTLPSSQKVQPPTSSTGANPPVATNTPPTFQSVPPSFPPVTKFNAPPFSAPVARPPVPTPASTQQPENPPLSQEVEAESLPPTQVNQQEAPPSSVTNRVIAPPRFSQNPPPVAKVNPPSFPTAQFQSSMVKPPTFPTPSHTQPPQPQLQFQPQPQPAFDSGPPVARVDPSVYPDPVQKGPPSLPTPSQFAMQNTQSSVVDERSEMSASGMFEDVSLGSQPSDAADSFFPSTYDNVSNANASTIYVPASPGSLQSQNRQYMGDQYKSDGSRPPIPLWVWGFGGKCAVMHPRQRRALSSWGNNQPASSADGPLVPGLFQMVEFGKYVNDPDLQMMASFPGPLRSHASKSQVMGWLKARIALLAKTRPDLDDLITLYEVLRIYLEHDGNIRAQNVKDSELSALRELAVLLRKDATLTSQFEESFTPDFSQLVVIESLMMEGKQAEALKVAVASRLWSHALFLAFHVNDQELFKSVMAQFASEGCSAGTPLRSLYLMLSGQMQSLVASDSKTLERWKESAAMLLCNGTLVASSAALGSLGDQLWSRERRVFAAHCCYVLAQTPIREISDPNARLVLIGGDHKRSPGSFVTPESVQRSEIWEYAKCSGNSQFVCYELEKYKLMYAGYLAELGEIDKAYQYCVSIQETLQNAPRSFQMDTYFQDRFKQFLDRIMVLRPNLRKVGKSGYVAPVLRGVGSLLSGALRVVAGADDDEEQEEEEEPAQQQQQPTQQAPVSAQPKQQVQPKKAQEQQPEEQGGGGWGFWPFGKKSAKEVKLGGTLERYYNEELKKWVRPGEEDQIRAAQSAPPPSDMLLRGGANTPTTPHPTPASTHVPPGTMGHPAPSTSMPGSSRMMSGPTPQNASSVPLNSAPLNFSRAGRQRRYVDTLNAGKPQNSVSTPSLPIPGASLPTAQFGRPPGGKFNVFVPKPASMGQSQPVQQNQPVEQQQPQSDQPQSQSAQSQSQPQSQPQLQTQQAEMQQQTEDLSGRDKLTNSVPTDPSAYVAPSSVQEQNNAPSVYTAPPIAQISENLQQNSSANAPPMALGTPPTPSLTPPSAVPRFQPPKFAMPSPGAVKVPSPSPLVSVAPPKLENAPPTMTEVDEDAVNEFFPPTLQQEQRPSALMQEEAEDPFDMTPPANDFVPRPVEEETEEKVEENAEQQTTQENDTVNDLL